MALHEVHTTRHTAGTICWLKYTRGNPETQWVLLHGFPDVPTNYEALIDALGDGTFWVAWMPGYGPSKLVHHARVDIMSNAEILLDGLQQLVTGPFILLGHDWGAAVAYAMAQLAPQRVQHLVTMAVPPIPSLARNIRHDPEQLQRSWYMGYLQTPAGKAAILDPEGTLVRRLWQDWSPELANPEALQRVLEAFEDAQTAIWARAYYLALFGRGCGLVRWSQNLRLAYRKIAVPATLFSGIRDGCIADSMYADAAQAFADPARVTVEFVPAGHFMQLEIPEQLAVTILQSIESVA